MAYQDIEYSYETPFKALIQARMEHLGASLTECANHLDVDVVCFRNWALGLTLPSAGYLRRVQLFLGISGDELIDALDKQSAGRGE